MQKHHEWLSNRGYVQHLQVLRSIKQRGKTDNQPSHLPKSTQFVKSPIKAPQKQQKILWDNYLLGKRIVETPPVISKRTLDRDYKNHQKLVQYLTASTSKRTLTTSYRLQKLRQYQEDAGVIDNDQRLKQTAPPRHLLVLQIIDLSFYRHRPTMDEVSIVLTCPKSDGKTRKISSECIPLQTFFNHQFYFRLPKRGQNLQNPLTIELRTIKGLDEVSLGCFSFLPTISSEIQGAKLYHCGKFVGEIEFVAVRGRKQTEPEIYAMHQRANTLQIARGLEHFASENQSLLQDKPRQSQFSAQ